jgi:hypothetical protein
VLWWSGDFFYSALVFYLLLMALTLPHWFFCFFGGDSGLMPISWLELAPSELNNGSCVDGGRGNIEGYEDDLGDYDGRGRGGSVGGIDPSI